MIVSVNNYIKIVFCVILIACVNDEDNTDLLSQSEVHSKGQQFSHWFNSYELDSLSNHIVDKTFSMQDLQDFREQVEDEYGQEQHILNEGFSVFWMDNTPVYGYVRYSHFSEIDHPVHTGFGFDRESNIYQFEVMTLPLEAPTNFSDYQTKTKLGLPFEGEWYVAWGGRSINLNQHAVAPDQRFAYDFLIKKDGYSFTDKGLNNDDYLCYAKKVFAPGDGLVVEVENTIRDNQIGEMPPISGNRVIIDHGNREYSVLSHFKEKSIVVTVGEKVLSGQFLGLTGNSGHSSEPHLHYHLQNTPVMFEGDGLPAQFEDYHADGKYVQRGEPYREQNIKGLNK